jgi:hypothetical protein
MLRMCIEANPVAFSSYDVGLFRPLPLMRFLPGNGPIL